MTELKAEQEKIEEYIGRVDIFLKYYETYPERINANVPYILEFFGGFENKCFDKLKDHRIKGFEDRFFSIYQSILKSIQFPK